MKTIEVRLLILVLAGALCVAGCHTTETVNVETYRGNPDLLKPGDTVTLHTHSEGKVKGKVVARSADEIVLKDGRKFATDQVLALEVHRFSTGKTIVAGLLILGGAALVAGIVIGIGYLYGHTACAPLRPQIQPWA